MTNGKSTPVVQSIIAESSQLCALGRTEEACSILEYFLDTEGDNPFILKCIAHIKMAQHKPHEAVPLLERALALIQVTKQIHPQKLRQQDTSNTILGQDEERCLSDSDIGFIEEISHEVKAQRSYYDWDDATSLIDEEISPQPESTSQSRETTRYNNQEDISEETLSSKEVENISDDLSLELSFQEELFGLDESAIIEEFLDLESIDDIPTINSANLTDFAYEHAWEEFEPVGVEYDNEIPEHDIFNLPTDNRLTRFERARQVALELGNEYGWDEDGINVLTMIFFKHWWSATRRSMRRELGAGVTPDELSLADEAREIWLKYPEFSEAHHGTYGIIQKYLHLPWPSALALIRSLGGYPDPAEIEKLLIDLYEHWREKPSVIDAYNSFRHYLEYQIGRGRSVLNLPPGLSFEAESYDSEACGILDADEIGDYDAMRRQLLDLGVDLESLDIHRIDYFRKWVEPNKEGEGKLMAEGTDEKNSAENPCEDFATYKKDNPNSPHAEDDNKTANIYRIGGRVRIRNGIFKNHEGEIINVNYNQQGKVKVLMSVLGHGAEANFYFDEVETI